LILGLIPGLIVLPDSASAAPMMPGSYSRHKGVVADSVLFNNHRSPEITRFPE
jgi:hypothetical protein